MNDNYEKLDGIITLNDEFGNEVQFEFLDIIKYNSEEYIVLLPVDDEEGVLVILKLESLDDDTVSYTSVEDEDALHAVFQIFKNKFKDEFDFDKEIEIDEPTADKLEQTEINNNIYAGNMTNSKIIDEHYNDVSENIIYEESEDDGMNNGMYSELINYLETLSASKRRHALADLMDILEENYPI